MQWAVVPAKAPGEFGVEAIVKAAAMALLAPLAQGSVRVSGKGCTAS